MSENWPSKKFQLIGGELCLDFCNTLGGKRGSDTREYLNSYLDLASWSEQAGIVPMAKAQALAAQAAAQPGEAAKVLKRAVDLRESLYRLFAAFIDGGNAPATDLARLNAELGQALCRLRLAPSSTKCCQWEWADQGVALDQLLGPLARSAAELLISSDSLPHLRRCGGDNCGWLFLDASKNHSRRWCDMRDCGNRAKVRRHRLKQRPDRG